jgi:hypothetical protein
VPRQPRPVQRWRRRSPRGGQARGAIRRHIASARMLALPEHFVSVRGPCHCRRWWHPLISTDREKNDKGDFASLRLSRLGRSGRRIQTFRSTPWQLTAGILERRKSTPSKGGRRDGDLAGYPPARKALSLHTICAGLFPYTSCVCPNGRNTGLVNLRLQLLACRSPFLSPAFSDIFDISNRIQRVSKSQDHSRFGRIPGRGTDRKGTETEAGHHPCHRLHEACIGLGSGLN